jgi:hypothetical protein
MHNRVIDMHALHQAKPGSNFLIEKQSESNLLYIQPWRVNQDKVIQRKRDTNVLMKVGYHRTVEVCSRIKCDTFGSYHLIVYTDSFGAHTTRISCRPMFGRPLCPQSVSGKSWCCLRSAISLGEFQRSL